MNNAYVSKYVDPKHKLRKTCCSETTAKEQDALHALVNQRRVFLGTMSLKHFGVAGGEL